MYVNDSLRVQVYIITAKPAIAKTRLNGFSDKFESPTDKIESPTDKIECRALLFILVLF